MINANALEQSIIDALLAGNDPILAVLRKQNDISIVKSREFTGVGFATHFDIHKDAPYSEEKDYDIDDIKLDIKNSDNGASARLSIRKGIIDSLEVVTHTGLWPKDAKINIIWYFKRRYPGNNKELVATEERDLSVTRMAWNK